MSHRTSVIKILATLTSKKCDRLTINFANITIFSEYVKDSAMKMLRSTYKEMQV